MTPERKAELRNTWRYHTVVTECLDEIDRLEALIADCKPLDDAIRQQERKRAATMVRKWAEDTTWFCAGQADSCFKMADEIEGGTP